MFLFIQIVQHFLEKKRLLSNILRLFYFPFMSSHLNRLKSRQLNRTMQKAYNSAYSSLSRTSITKVNVVRFGQDEVICSGRKQSMQSSQNQKENVHTGSKLNFKIRSALKKNLIVKSEMETGFSDKTDEIFQNLVKYSNIRLPATIRKIYGETAKLTTTLLNSPILSRSSIMRELKCLMSNSPVHESYLLSKGMVYRMKEKIKKMNNDKVEINFNYDQVAILIKKITEHCSDSQQLLTAYEKLLTAHKYPISIELMLLYIGVYLHQINSSYERAEEICKRFLDQLLKLRMDEYITIYLILMIKLKSNLCEWSKVVSLISKALAAAWVYRLDDLEIWCYFQLSRAHFALGNTESCQFFKQRSQMSITQKQSTIYREMMQQGYKKQIQHMRIHNYYFNLDTSITYEQLTDHNQRERPSVTLKAQVYAKSIAEQFKIKHVKNLITRLGEDSRHCQSKKEYAGNPQFLTHESGIKNLNVYFRIKHKRGEEKKLYTYENSSKNYLILKEMMRCLLIQMKWFVPLTDV